MGGIGRFRIPFTGGAAVVQALIAGDVDTLMIGPAQVNAERMTALAQTGEKRSASLPEVPTFTELGLPQFQGLLQGLYVRSGTPKFASAKIFSAASFALQQPEVVTGLTKNQFQVSIQSAEATARRFAADVKLFSDIANALGIEPK